MNKKGQNKGRCKKKMKNDINVEGSGKMKM